MFFNFKYETSISSLSLLSHCCNLVNENGKGCHKIVSIKHVHCEKFPIRFASCQNWCKLVIEPYNKLVFETCKGLKLANVVIRFILKDLSVHLYFEIVICLLCKARHWMLNEREVFVNLEAYWVIIPHIRHDSLK